MSGHGELVLRLILALMLGGVIGLERESHGRPAGLRTHILVCVGSTLIMLISLYAFDDAVWPRRDPARLAAQVVSGIGFLGAGTILHEGITVIGLTTAASLWVVAGIGLAVGSGFYVEAAFVAGLAFAVLFFLDRLERKVMYSKRGSSCPEVTGKPDALSNVVMILGRCGVSIKGVNLQIDSEGNTASIELVIDMPIGISKERLLEEISRLAELRSTRNGARR